MESIRTVTVTVSSWQYQPWPRPWRQQEGLVSGSCDGRYAQAGPSSNSLLAVEVLVTLNPVVVVVSVVVGVVDGLSSRVQGSGFTTRFVLFGFRDVGLW